MAEVKNSFLSSKMNKDLDDRLIPNSEYRDALNIEVGKSETNNIGVLQNVYGNIEIPKETIPDLECIGIFMDNQNNRIYQFLTNYTDPSPSQITLCETSIFQPMDGWVMKITVYDLNTSTYSTLVEGTFLNFSKTNLVIGVNLVEGLLFWSDNRNQPRKINYNKAISNPTYYTTETQISVAKYAPVEPIFLVKKATATVVSSLGNTYVLSNMNSTACTIGSVSGGPTTLYTATITTSIANGFYGFLVGDIIAGPSGTGTFGLGPVIITSLISSTSITVSSKNMFSAGTASVTLRYAYLGAIQAGSTIVSQTVSGSEYIYIMSVANDSITIYNNTTIPPFPPNINPGDELIFLTSTMTNQSDDPQWPGDPSFLEDKYVRFSYRFKFDDNEYSLMAPFTQIAYIPRQKGYFINGDETAAYRSTIIKWMENNVNNIELLIPLPDKGLTVNDTYKITNVEILYKESDALAVKVIDSIPWVAIKNTIPDTNIYTYSYQSQKPYKTLSESQTTRVYDIVPTRAIGQEVAGNRVIYANFYTSYTPPANINYNTAVQPKSDKFTAFVEYPNHTLKQNRNYQVGFILADKFGRQSSVLLSSVDLTTTTSGSINFGGSTVYAPYQSETGAFPDVRDWFGNALLVLVNDPISSQRNIPAGTPGLYAEPTSPNGFAIVTSSILGNFYTFTLDTLVTGSVKPIVGNYLRGALTDYVKVLSINPTGFADQWIVETTSPVNDLYLPAVPTPPVDAKFAYTLNQIGWYSYKVVVKQQQQDYYNVYLPGMLDGYPSGQTFGSQVIYTGVLAEPKLENSINTTSFPVGETGKTSHIVLINDNINKVPRDLNEVGPDQKQYRSSVQLFGRVENSAAQEQLVGDINYTYDNQYATTITYLLSANPTALNSINPGDGIQCNQAKATIPNPTAPSIAEPNPPATIDNPDAWYANTVVVSNELFNYTADLDANALPGDEITLTNTTYQLVENGDTFTYTLAGITYNNEVLSIAGQTIKTVTAFAHTITTDIILYFTSPTKGLITFSPPNWTRTQSSVPPTPGAYINFTITRAENIQYFPARKADVVSSIASATDFNFLDNTVDNIKGTAGLNFYQLQTRPLIGRVSTTKSIGVTSEFMVPFLSVYETAPDVSALALFWETASTGLISDLNYDVANGFNGPTGFSDLGFSFFEFQDSSGVGEETGAQNSKYITDPFSVLNATGFPLIPDVPLTFSYVYTDADPDTDISNKFAIEEFPIGSGTWRFTINPLVDGRFVFDHNAPLDSNFTFKVKVVYDGIDYIITYKNRLSNNFPFFIESYPNYNETIDQTLGDIEIITAENGAYSNLDNQTDLYWEIISGDPIHYFQINPATGMLSLVNSNVPLGIYELFIRVSDAFLIDPPTPLVNGNSNYATKKAETQVNITVGPKPVNRFLERYDTGQFIWNQPEGTECVILPGQGYGAVYIGKSNLDVNPYSTLPNLLNTTPAPAVNIYQDYVNVQVENGASFPANPPQGLTQGELEFTITTFGLGNIDEIRRSNVNFILYFREPTAPNNTWQSILDSNNVGSPNSASVPWQNGVGDHLGITINTSDLAATRSTSLVVSNPTGVAVGEYCLIVWHEYFARVDGPDPGPLSCGDSFYTSVQVKDANYDYAVPLPPVPVPLAVVPIKYSVQLRKPGFPGLPSAIPYNTQNASIGFPFQTSAIVDVDALAGQNTIKITAPNSQIVPGIWVGSYQVSDVQIDGVTLILSSNLTVQINAGDPLDFNTFNYPGQVLTGYTGSVWATTNNPLHVRQFYIDSTLTILWNPPLADAFYLFYNTDRDFDNPLNVPVPGMGVPTNKPICCAKIGTTGQIVPQTAPTNKIQTAWRITPEALANYGRNIYQFTEIP